MMVYSATAALRTNPAAIRIPCPAARAAETDARVRSKDGSTA
jgi:hypothetical protein